ncbi:MAG: response regulator [Clostridiales bacterium]|nr:response regulator [Clostridiales bacterium]
MFRVFLVEDDGAAREALRKTIPWEEYGFTCIGEAPDGEAALPMLRRHPTDLLLTDVEMPFMDGLALSQRVRQEFPETKIILFSESADFEQARRAIEIGVERYLRKPLSSEAVTSALTQVREKLLAAEEQRSDTEKLRQAAREYQRVSRRRFFEKLVTGYATVEEIYNEAQALGLDLDAQGYNIVLCYAARRTMPLDQREQAAGRLAETQREIEAFLRRCPQFLLFRWSLTVTAVLIKAEEIHAEAETELCVTGLRRCLAEADDGVDWYLAAGSPVQRLSALDRCFGEASDILSYRHLCPGQHVLTRDSLAPLRRVDTEQQLRQASGGALAPEVLQGFLKNGTEEELPAFVDRYLRNIGEDVLNSALLSQYVMLNVRFTAAAFVQDLGYGAEELTEVVDSLPPIERLFGTEAVERYVTRLLTRALELRKRGSRAQRHESIRQGLRYIDQNYTQSGLSLGEVAANSKVSPNYFSALFRQEMGCTFVDYLTQKRMDRAKELLRDSGLRTGEIALAVGYRDVHYFSTIFRKTQGCTPREYRARRGKG